ncbi:hypothetical protein [Halopiger goleimassiliensis]|uniref:hypothetical protein n=1 Tax=Halopiger goleimassiliensis TaxID=1293048 RepID=UPI0006781717|nr:hypothetical protein [Halopiger goleimassiliensis]
MAVSVSIVDTADATRVARRAAIHEDCGVGGRPTASRGTDSSHTGEIDEQWTATATPGGASRTGGGPSGDRRFRVES